MKIPFGVLLDFGTRLPYTELPNHRRKSIRKPCTHFAQPYISVTDEVKKKKLTNSRIDRIPILKRFERSYMKMWPFGPYMGYRTMHGTPHEYVTWGQFSKRFIWGPGSEKGPSAYVFQVFKSFPIQRDNYMSSTTSFLRTRN